VSDNVDLRALIRSQERRSTAQAAHIEHAAHEDRSRGGDQLSLLADVPVAGDRYRTEHQDRIATVLRVEQRRRCWVTVRINGQEREFKLTTFQEHFRKV
jgi:hypothetical protein